MRFLSDGPSSKRREYRSKEGRPDSDACSTVLNTPSLALLHPPATSRRKGIPIGPTPSMFCNKWLNMSEATESIKPLVRHGRLLHRLNIYFSNDSHQIYTYQLKKLHHNQLNLPVSAGPGITVLAVVPNGAANCHARLLVTLCYAAFDAA